MSSYYSREELENIGFKELGENVSLSRYAKIYGASKISIGSNVRIDDFVVLSGTITMGNNIHIAVGTLLYGGDEGIVLEDFAVLSSRNAIYAKSDDYSGEYLISPTVPEKYTHVTGGKVILHKYSLVGTGCTILPGVEIGEGTAVGAMSLVNKSLDEWKIYVGIPCRVLKERSREMVNKAEDYLRSLE